MGGSCCNHRCEYEQFFIERVIRTNPNKTPLYDKFTKYCSTCAKYMRFKSVVEYAENLICPCCNFRFRIKPTASHYRRQWWERNGKTGMEE